MLSCTLSLERIPMSFELSRSATASAEMLVATSTAPVLYRTSLTTAFTGLKPSSHSLLFVDRSIVDYQQLVAGVAPGTEIHVLDSRQDAVTQITQVLLERESISSLHIVSHGEAGGLDFGAGRLSLSELPNFASQIQSWSNALTESADILLYGCKVAAGELGKAFVQILSQLTRADVAASDDLTGSATKGGDWTLEYQTVRIETGLAVSSAATLGYEGVLGGTTNSFISKLSQVPNLAPTLTMSATTLGYTENDLATLIDPTATVADSTSTNFDTGTLTVSYSATATVDDRLAIRNQGTSTGQISLDGRIVKFEGAEIGTYTGGLGTTPLVITFNSASATPAAAQALLRAITFSNVSQSPSTTARSLQVTVSDGSATSTPATRTINVTAVNDAPSVGTTTVLYNGALGTLPSSQGWTYGSSGGTPTVSGSATNINTTGNPNFFAGFGNNTVTLDRTAGYVVSFNAQVVSESRTATADKNLDGKDDRAGFSIIVVSSDNTKAIELGFLSDRIFAQEDGTHQVNPSLQPDTTAPNATRTLFTQAEAAAFTTTAATNYDLAIKDDTYTLFAKGIVLLSGRLRDYTRFNGTPDPYQVPNQIFLGDNTTSAAANLNLSRVAVTTHPATLPSQTVNEDGVIVLPNLFLSDLDAGSSTVTLTLAVTNGTVTVNEISGGTLSNNGTATVTVTGTLNQINTLLTNATGIRYQGNANYNGTDTLTLSLNDNGASGSAITTTKTLPIVINSVNDAPTLTGNGTLPAVTQNTTNPSGSNINSLFSSLFNDVDASASLSGLAIVSNPATSTQGQWQYSIDGAAWAPIGSVTDGATALALSASTLMRFVPAVGYSGTPPSLTVRALDNTYSGGFTNSTTRITVNTTSNGGTTAISDGTPATLSTSVTKSLPNLLWRNSGTGENAVWQINNFTFQTGYVLPKVSDPGWQIVSNTVDFNHDRIADILWRNQVTGENAIWQMSNTGLQSADFLYRVADTHWQIVSTADFNGDGKSDILWRNQATGENAMWQMNGATIQSPDVLYRVTDTNWQIVSTADFNGDGKSDILWRNQATGENAMWQMNGATIQSPDVLHRVADINWQIVSTADFNGDGKADILWRNQATGENAMWQMNGTMLQKGYVINSLADVNWQISGVTDLGGDGTPDILWRNKQTGKEMIWQLSGFSYVQTYALPDVSDPNWSVKPFVADLERAASFV